ncbi:hypothetical protein LJR066_002841 [Acidovorax sp. LjRoot66]|uniref:hypothetical protein n=1 Tax=Acidovorax sp. LjRoot66 TaxID=3342334 RepID=UPI003ED07C2E
MATTPAKPPRIGPFPLGMDNRAPDFALALPDGGHLLRDAVNVDVTQQGVIKTRPGYALSESGLDCHSGWSPRSGAYGLYCDSGDIYRIDVAADGTTARTQVATGYGRVTPVVYCEVNEAIYFTDGIRVGSYHPVAGGPTPRWLDAAPRMVGDVQLAQMPPGACIAHQGARLLVAVGRYLLYSEPFTPGLRDEAKNWAIFPMPITAIIAVEAGVFVLSDKTYWLPGGLPAQALRAVKEYGGPLQQPSYQNDGAAHWMSLRGLMGSNAAGELANLQEAHVAIEVEGAASTLFRETDGMKTILSALSTPSSAGAGVGSYIEATIHRKATP